MNTSRSPRLAALLDEIAGRINVHVVELGFDVRSYLEALPERIPFVDQPAHYGMCPDHPVAASFRDAAAGGSYFLGRCEVRHAAVWGSDLRGDELKRAGQSVGRGEETVLLREDERIEVSDAVLLETLVHNCSPDPESPERFAISATAAMPWSNIHGAPTRGAFLGALATVDLTTVRSAVVGPFAYVQVGALAGARVDPGEIWLRGADFELRFTHDGAVLRRYVSQEPGGPVRGILADIMRQRAPDIAALYGETPKPRAIPIGAGASVSPYAFLGGTVAIGENVLVSQSAHVTDTHLGRGANVQENCVVAHSRLDGLNVNAHGATVIHAHCGARTFVGFNALLRGTAEAPVALGQGSIVMPHSLIDAAEPLDIPPDTLVWGHVRSPGDLPDQSVALEELARVTGSFERGGLRFSGSGARFVEAFRHRIEHILEANGAFFDGTHGRGHAQTEQAPAFCLLQPYAAGERAGLLPTVTLTA